MAVSTCLPEPLFPSKTAPDLRLVMMLQGNTEITLRGNRLISQGLGLECHLAMSKYLYKVCWWLQAGGFGTRYT